MSDNIYDILQRFQRLDEDISAQQRAVKQLPALFQPPASPPSSTGFQKNATRGYLVGEAEESINPMAQAVTRRIVNQHPEWIVKYGVEFLMQVIDDVTEGEEDWEEIGSSDVSAYVRMVGDQLRDRAGSREEMDEGNIDPNRHPQTRDYGPGHDDKEEEDDVPFQPDVKSSDRDQFGNPIKHRARHLARRGMRQAQGLGEAQETATEDVLSTMKKKLGDYLQDVATAIKTDPDLKDKIPQSIDQIKAVKTMRTDDGHEIKITGNEDDGFRISIKNKQSDTKFANLDEATMAVEMFCARRRKAAESADYIEEA
jgi:hypothetical protein